MTTTIKNKARNAARTAADRAARSKIKGSPRGPRKNGATSYGTARSKIKDAPLSREELNKIDAYWRAANYLSVGQIYLYENPLLKKPLSKEHIKPRLLGHWGTTPGLNFIYAHLNRLIKKHDLDMLYITGPGRQRLPRGNL